MPYFYRLLYLQEYRTFQVLFETVVFQMHFKTLTAFLTFFLDMLSVLYIFGLLRSHLFRAYTHSLDFDYGLCMKNHCYFHCNFGIFAL